MVTSSSSSLSLIRSTGTTVNYPKIRYNEILIWIVFVAWGEWMNVWINEWIKSCESDFLSLCLR